MNVILLGTLLAGCLGLWVATELPPVYRAVAILHVDQLPDTPATSQSFASAETVKTYVELTRRRPVIEAAAKGLGLSAADLLDQIRVRHIADTPLIEISTEAAVPQIAQLHVARVVDSLLAFTERSKAIYPHNLVIVEPAGLPQGADFSLAIRLAVGMVLFGFLLSVAAVVLYDFLDERFADVATIEQIVGVPVLLATPLRGQQHRALLRQLPAMDNLRPELLENYRAMCFALRNYLDRSEPYTILITAPVGNEESAAATLYFGRVLADAGKQVLLLDANLRQPKLHRAFQLKRNTVEEYSLRPHTSIFTYTTNIPNLALMTIKDAIEEPLQLLSSPLITKVINRAKQGKDVVLISAPEVLESMDAAVLASYADDTLMLLDHRRTQKEMARRTFQVLNGAGANVIGAILINYRSTLQKYHIDFQLIAATRFGPVELLQKREIARANHNHVTKEVVDSTEPTR